MSKLLFPSALTLSLALVACQSGLNQTPEPISAQTTKAAEVTRVQNPSLTAQTMNAPKVQPFGHVKSTSQQQIEVNLTYPQTLQNFSTQAFDCGEAAFVSLEVTGAGLTSSIYADGAGNQNMTPTTGCNLSGTLSNVPYGHIVVTAKLYDANRNPLAGSELVSGIYFTSNTNLELSYRQTNVGQVLKQLQSGTAEDKFLAQQLNLAALQSFFDTVTGVSGSYPGYTFITQPSLVNVSEVVADLKANGGSILTLDAQAAKYKAAAGSLSLQVNGLMMGKNVSASVDDPTSEDLTLSTNGQITLNNVPPGQWTLRVSGDDYNPQRIPVTVTGGQALPVTLNLTLYPGKRIYVNGDATGSNDGSSWSNAYTHLQTALTAAKGMDEIWIAKGKYKPTTDSNQRVSFHMKENVHLYGGFRGDETLISQRDVVNNITVLSGDLDGDDDYSTTPPTNISDNSKTILVSSVTQTIDGLTLQGSSGEGVVFNEGTHTVENAVFSDMTSASAGGALKITGGSTHLSNVSFLRNTALQGAAIFAEGGDITEANKLVFKDNTDTSNAGGVLEIQSISQDWDWQRIIFYENDAQGSAIHANLYRLSGTSKATLRLTHLLIANNTFYENTSNITTGDEFSRIEIYNSTIANNSCAEKNDGFCGAVFSIYNSIFENSYLFNRVSWKDTPDTFASTGGNISLPADSMPFLDSSDVDGEDDILFTADDGYHPVAGSPAINTGVDEAFVPGDVPITDIVGRSRNGVTDSGAYEYIP